MSHSTIAKARKALDDNNITTIDQLNGYTDDDLVSLISDRRSVIADHFVAIDIDA